jgi:hypothetical protein
MEEKPCRQATEAAPQAPKQFLLMLGRPTGRLIAPSHVLRTCQHLLRRTEPIGARPSPSGTFCDLRLSRCRRGTTVMPFETVGTPRTVHVGKGAYNNTVNG